MGFDNGSDYLSKGLYRIILNSKIGYANEQGKIVITPSFENRKAKVSYPCDIVDDGEHQMMISKA